MKVSNEKLETLRELANAANTWSALDNTPLMPYSKADCEYGSRDHQFIAAANPETVSAMAQELVELRAQNKWVKVGKDTMPHLDGVLVWVQYADGSFGCDSTVEEDGEWAWESDAEVAYYHAIPASPEEEGK